MLFCQRLANTLTGPCPFSAFLRHAEVSPLHVADFQLRSDSNLAWRTGCPIDIGNIYCKIPSNRSENEGGKYATVTLVSL